MSKVLLFRSTISDTSGVVIGFVACICKAGVLPADKQLIKCIPHTTMKDRFVINNGDENSV